MRRFLLALGAVFLALLAAGGIGVGVMIYNVRAVNAEAKAYVDDAVPAITGAWDRDELLKRAAPELLAKTTPAEIRSLFETYSRMGPLTKYEGATGNSFSGYTTGSGHVTTASYVAKVLCKNGRATIKITLVKHGKLWLIGGFFVDASSSSPPAHSI